MCFIAPLLGLSPAKSPALTNSVREAKKQLEISAAAMLRLLRESTLVSAFVEGGSFARLG